MALEQALMAIKALHLSGVPLLSSCADCELSASLVCREEAGISPCTFSKCHKEGEMHSCNFCASVKTSQLGGEMYELRSFMKMNSSTRELIYFFLIVDCDKSHLKFKF